MMSHIAFFCFVPCFLGRDETLGTPHTYVNCSCSCIYLYQSLRGKISLKIFSSADPSEAQWTLSPQGLSAFMPVMSLISQPLMHRSSTTAPLTQARGGVLGDKICAWEVHNVRKHLVHVQPTCHILQVLHWDSGSLQQHAATEHASAQVLLQWPNLGWDGVVLCWKSVKGLIDTSFSRLFRYVHEVRKNCVLARLALATEEERFAIQDPLSPFAFLFFTKH